MITVTLNRTEFEYDIHSLIKAFFPKEDVELYYTKEAHADEKCGVYQSFCGAGRSGEFPFFD